MTQPPQTPTDPDAGATAGVLSPLRTRYVAAARVAVDLLASAEVAQAWDGASVLAEFGVGDLAGHLARSVFLVHDYLDLPDPRAAQPVQAGPYFAALEGADDVHSQLNVSIRQRGHELAVDGPLALAERAAAALDGLVERLGTEPLTRQVEARGHALLLEEYLRTRIVEIVVHVEDLELSVGLGPGLGPGDDVPDLPDDAVADAVEVLLAAARHRHGDAAVLRALARRERDVVNALRVF